MKRFLMNTAAVVLVLAGLAFTGTAQAQMPQGQWVQLAPNAPPVYMVRVPSGVWTYFPPQWAGLNVQSGWYFNPSHLPNPDRVRQPDSSTNPGATLAQLRMEEQACLQQLGQLREDKARMERDIDIERIHGREISGLTRLILLETKNNITILESKLRTLQNQILQQMRQGATSPW